jgi:hypothetical protein
MKHHPEQGHSHSYNGRKQWAIHKDWRVWTAVILMLLAMAVYVISMDESIQPAGEHQVPAEAMGAE